MAISSVSFMDGLRGLVIPRAFFLGASLKIWRSASCPNNRFPLFLIEVIGQTMLPILDSLGVSREKLAYVVDATAAPIASLVPVSSWVGFEVGLIQVSLFCPALNAIVAIFICDFLASRLIYFLISAMLPPTIIYRKN